MAPCFLLESTPIGWAGHFLIFKSDCGLLRNAGVPEHNQRNEFTMAPSFLLENTSIWWAGHFLIFKSDCGLLQNADVQNIIKGMNLFL